MTIDCRVLTFVDLFAGCGGLSLGLEQAGFQPIFVNEIDHDAMETYLRNRDDRFPLLRSRHHLHDIKDLLNDREIRLRGLVNDFRKHYSIDTTQGDLDLLTGGPPCQGFSAIGHRRSYLVDRASIPSNHLFQDMAQVICRLSPKIFLFENVKGLLSAKWTPAGRAGEIWDDVLNTFGEIPGYSVSYALVHARDYGVPQNRPRVILIGLRDDIGFRPNPNLRASGLLPEPLGRAPGIVELLGDLVDPSYSPGMRVTSRYPRSATTAVQKDVRQDPETGKIYRKGDLVSEQIYSVHRPDIVKKFQYMIDNSGEIPLALRTSKFAQRLLPREWGPSGPTITATSLPDDYVHFIQPRILTVREWARLQMFPDWYQFYGKRTTGGLRRAGDPSAGKHERELPKYTQIGNAVPVSMAHAIGQHLRHILEGS